MRKIIKQISLEPYKSRLPGVAPSISGGTFVDFIEPEHIRKGYGNYGLVPSDVIVPEEIASGITDYTDIYVNLISSDGSYALLEDNSSVPDGDGIYQRHVYIGGEERMVLSYQTVMEWYRFMLRYEDLLDGTLCRSYTSATEYFDIQVGGTPTEREAYEELDRQYSARGGKKFFLWVSENIIPTFRIPKEYTDKWGTKVLYYPDALVWKGWFDERHKRYSGITDCKLSDDCCDCEEYYSRGGSNMRMLLEEWCKTTKRKIVDNNENFTRQASLNIPISLVRNIDNMGEMSIFSGEWEPGVYYGRTYGDGAGTVVWHNGMTYAIDGQKKGFRYNEDFKEIEFATDEWMDHTLSYINRKYEDFVPMTSYTYNRYGVVIINPTDDDFTEHFAYTKKDVVLIGGSLYDVVDGFWVEFKGGSGSLINGKRLQVDFSSNGIPYTVVNRRKYVARRSGMGYYFCFGKSRDFNSPMVEGKFIRYGSKLYDVTDGSVNVDGIEYKVLNGYFTDEDGTVYYVYDGKLCFEAFEDRAVQEFIEVDNDAWKRTSVGDDGILEIVYNYEVHETKYITGFTSNKSGIVMDKVISTDDIGKELPGRIIDKESAYNQPSECELLDLYFHVGNVSNISFLGVSGEEEVHLFNGNVITRMEFYYLGGNGKRVDGLSVTREMKPDGTIENSGDTSIELIDELNRLADGFDDIDRSVVYCDMTYHVGAILVGEPDGPLYGKRRMYTFNTENSSSMAIDAVRYSSNPPQRFNAKVDSYVCEEDISNEVKYNRIYLKIENGDYAYYPGIIYKDTLILEKDECFFNMSEEENYPLNYYSVKVNAYDPTKMNEMDDSLYTQHSYFETPILIYTRNSDDGNVEPRDAYFRESRHFERFNGIAEAPLFRQDWQIGLSSRESLESDIYVDRGAVAALDKHLKLGEVKTMEALENYSNGMLKIKQDQ